MHEQVVHGFDVFGKESHCGSFFVEGTHSAAGVVVAAPICSIADTRQQADPEVVPAGAENVVMEQETLRRINVGPIDIRDSNPERDDICTACDSRGDRRPKLALSRTAQRHVFALWVLASGAIGRRLPSIPSMGFQLLPPRREDECTDC
jgi:hypothetical protein